MKAPRVLALLSGGLDSIAMCRVIQSRVSLRLVGALTIDYGQPAAVEETTAAAEWCHKQGIPWREKALVLDAAALTGDGACVVPARNAALIALAANWAPRMKADTVAIGATGSDRRDYRDCRSEFIAGLDVLMRQAYGVGVIAPLAHMEKHEAVSYLKPGDAEAAFSCYTPAGLGRHCGRCRSCSERALALGGHE